jgi:hypothetical protein
MENKHYPKGDEKAEESGIVMTAPIILEEISD